MHAAAMNALWILIPKTTPQARNTITSMLREIIKGRRAAAAAAAADDDAVHNDMLEVLLGASASARGQQLNDEQIIDLIIIFMYSGFETVSTTSMMAIKYLSQNPNALKHLRVRTCVYI